MVALSTAPVRHPVREPIEQSRRKYGGTVYHLYKNNFPDKTELISSILQSYETPSEVEQITKELHYWLEEQWLDAPDVAARLAILNVVQMALESASQPLVWDEAPHHQSSSSSRIPPAQLLSPLSPWIKNPISNANLNPLLDRTPRAGTIMADRPWHIRAGGSTVARTDRCSRR